MTVRAISGEQLTTLDGCCRLVVQRITKVRSADATVQRVTENPKQYAGPYIREAEKNARFESRALVTAVDELKDLLAELVPQKSAPEPALTAEP